MARKRLPEVGSFEVSPSILSGDFSNLQSEIKEVEAAGLNMLHLDVMDGHFVPNLTFGPPVVAKMRKHTDMVFDTHLMITNPEKYAKPFVDAGSDHITFHVEVVDDPAEFIKYLHGLGATCGVTLNPETPVETVEKVAPLCDMVLVMTVHPGFSGQEYIAAAAKKIVTIREIVGPNIRIEVDGGISPETVPEVVGFGADTFVAGSAVFGKSNRAKAIRYMLDAAEEAKSRLGK
ncbi:Ribulose-phosphate 3-epimerase [Anaerohalosphaera lusitana]|uniref:Ribulose-phosphate 3-epimerase n=1 Tax=Anaerohalosphaera lusitana TaxID=1936003 RepID=A0A1U9NIR8_9BACT|nr:ribulose-phosphate 3-epimerase [Anaerohalosphaera lusitana]AQT67638.1 Ribulose-phosphate 3-epimerase [Anaerohalosphaera lusitana]